MPKGKGAGKNTLQTLYHEQLHCDVSSQAGWEGEMRFYDTYAACDGFQIQYGTYSNERDEQLVVTRLSREFRRAFFKAWSEDKVT